MSGVTRFGVSLDERLLAKFDRLIDGKGYANRSEAIRDLIRESLVREQWELGDADAVGTLTLVYDHETRELEERLTELQHAHYQAIVSTLHVHLDHRLCLEVMALRGKPAELQRFSARLIGMKGVKHGQLVLSSAGLWKESKG